MTMTNKHEWIMKKGEETKEKQMVRFAFTMKKKKDVGEIRIYGAITPYMSPYGDTISSSAFAEKLKELGDVDKLVIYINTPGGNVTEGKAIRSELMLHKAKEKHFIVMGDCASAGTLPACIPKKDGVRVSMADGTEYMIHNPTSWIGGTAEDMEKAAQMLHKLEEEVADIYQKRTGIAVEEIRKMMDEQTQMNAKEAVEKGFADDVIESVDEDEDGAGMCQTREEWEQMGFEQVPEMYIVNKATMQAQTKTQVSNAAPAATENKTSEGKGRTNMPDTTMSMEQLQQEQPALYNSVLAEGARMERQRMDELDKVYAPGHADMVHEAKYGEKPMTAAELSLKLNATMREEAEKKAAAEMKAKGDFLQNRATETVEMTKVPGEANDGTPPKEDPKMKVNEAASAMAKFANDPKPAKQ